MSEFDMISWMNGAFFGTMIAAAFVLTGYADVGATGFITMALLYLFTGLIIISRFE